jgi:High potential iron-sulfur protein
MPGRQVSPSKNVRAAAIALSRRQLFTTLAGTAAIAALLSCGAADIARAQSKTDKKTAKYQDHPNKGQQCANCQFFRPPKSCQLVEGDISPNGWCSYFAKKS